MNYAPEFAGVGRYTGEIGSHLAALGHKVCVVTTPPHYPGWVARPGHSAARWTKETLHGAKVYRCPLYVPARPSGKKRILHLASFALSSLPVALWQALVFRPQVVMIEATVPETPIRRQDGCRDLLTGMGWRHAWFDGLNDWYLAPNFEPPNGAFDAPPNIFDHYVTRRTVEAAKSIIMVPSFFRTRPDSNGPNHRTPVVAGTVPVMTP